MGTVIAINFRQRRPKHADPGQGGVPGLHGDAVAVAICVACLACLQAPLLTLWSPWLSLLHPQARRCSEGVEES